MPLFTMLRNAAVAAIAVVGLELSGVVPVNATDTISQYGYWAAVTDVGRNGDAICGVQTHMANGGELRLMVIDGAVHLVAFDPSWTMRSDATPRVRITVDGEVYRGTGVAADAQTLVVESLTWDFVEQFMAGTRLDANLGGVRWSVSLIGSSRATNTMADCAEAARRELVS